MVCVRRGGLLAAFLSPCRLEPNTQVQGPFSGHTCLLYAEARLGEMLAAIDKRQGCELGCSEYLTRSRRTTSVRQ